MLEKGEGLEDNTQYYGDYNSTSYNYTDIENYVFDYEYDINFIKHYQVPLLAFPFTFGTINNVILIIIIRNKDMRTVPNMYILNLAVSDIIYLTLLITEACSNKISGKWLDGDFMCTLLPFCRRLSVGLSAYSVAVFSFQGYRITVNLLQVRVSSPPTWLVTVATICEVWIVAVPTALSKYLCVGFFDSKNKDYYHFVVIFEHLVSCVLPLGVVAFSYFMTARYLVKSSRSISEGTQNPHLKTRRNAAKFVMGIAFVFIISYVLYHAFRTYFIYSDNTPYLFKFSYIFDHSNYKFQYTYLISRGFLFINSCLNPVALFPTSFQFRRHLKRYLTCFCKTNVPATDFRLTRRN